MPTPAKEAKVSELRDLFEKSQALCLTEFRGLSVAHMYELRSQVIAAGGQMAVVKNRLMQIAVAGTPAEGLAEYLEGPTAVIFCDADPVAPAKAVTEYGKTHDYVALKAAYVDGRIFNAQQAVALAELPPTDQIKSMVVGAIAGPLNGVFGAVNGALTSLLYVLQGKIDKEQGS
jgi:large subunit ribosomal protein L10